MPDQTLHHTIAEKRPKSGRDPLLQFLTGAVGRPVCLSADGVERIDSLRLRTLLSAQKKWADDGLSFRVTKMADPFRAGLARLGLTPGHFDEEDKT